MHILIQIPIIGKMLMMFMIIIMIIININISLTLKVLVATIDALGHFETR